MALEVNSVVFFTYEWAMNRAPRGVREQRRS